MKNTFIVLCAAAAIFAAQAIPASAAPDAHMQPLQYLLGTWHCNWTAGGQTGSVDQTFSSVMNGVWVEERETTTAPNGQVVLNSIHYTGWDPARKAYVHSGPDADGSYQLYRSPDLHEWRNALGAGAPFYLTRDSDTQQTESTTINAVGGQSVEWKQTCTKA